MHPETMLGNYCGAVMSFLLLLERRKKASAWERNLVYPAVMVLLLIETVSADRPGGTEHTAVALLYRLRRAAPQLSGSGKPVLCQ